MTTADPTVANQPQVQRKQRLLIVLLLVILAVIAYGAYWYFHARFYVSTDNAYVSGNTVTVTSEVNGTVTSVEVNDTQPVQRGQLLVSLDPTDAQIAVSSAEAELARTVRMVRGLLAQAAGLEAQIDSQQTALANAEEDLTRRQQVAKLGGVSSEELQHARNEVTRQKAALDTAKKELEQVNAQIVGTDIETHPDVLAAAAKLREASLALARTKIYAPVTGTVAQSTVEIGTRIAQGKPLLTVVPLDNVWVNANFKEVQLASVQVGQPVTLHADLYGGDQEYHGVVEGISAGTGSAFALLPAQNASGNWIKIVQRLPVRIALNAEELASHPLRVGLSMTAEIDISGREGNKVAQANTGKQASRLQRDWDHTDIDRRITQIITNNSGDVLADTQKHTDVALEAAL